MVSWLLAMMPSSIVRIFGDVRLNYLMNLRSGKVKLETLFAFFSCCLIKDCRKVKRDY